MKEFECPDPNIVVLRGVVDSFLASFGVYQGRGEKVVKRHLGITELDDNPNSTYSLQKYLGAMRELQEQFGTTLIRKVGTYIFDKAVFPPGLDTLEKVMSAINTAYYMNHVVAPGQIGSYVWTQDDEKHGTMVCDNPYPCAFDRGIFESISTRFAPGSTVTHAEGPCRHRGDDTCTYRIAW